MYSRKVNIVIVSLVLIGFSACLKNDEKDIVVAPQENNTSEEIINYLERNGDFINSADCPAVVEAEEVYSNMYSYLLIDLRLPGEYSFGHIETAVNVQHNNLLAFLETQALGNFSKIILISKNGQSSAYYAALLRLYGMKNVFSMNYGMAAWHEDFSEDWIEVLQSETNQAELSIEEFPKGKFNPFPMLEFSNPQMSTKEKINERITVLLNKYFPEEKKTYSNQDPSIQKEEYFVAAKNLDYYLVCCGIYSSYIYRLDQTLIMGHLRGAIHYSAPPNSDFRSSLYLQTIPSDKKVFIYSHEGNLSAFFTAYLQLLGYDAVSMLYGLNTIYPDLIGLVPTLVNYVFTYEKIKNYPYSS
ncbi:MAG: rhodanese-like domain-containing protein [Ignavibacteriaceae bacterium]